MGTKDGPPPGSELRPSASHPAGAQLLALPREATRAVGSAVLERAGPCVPLPGASGQAV